MSMRSDTDDYFDLFVNDVPLMDVRAPVEFTKGAFPCAANIPLLDDSQREQIGIRYKNAGEQEAIELGLQLATPQIRAQRISDWQGFCRNNPNGYLYCFRGGLRSQTVQQWLRDQGLDYPLVKGGYKAMRRFLLEELERSVARGSFVLISGKTGSGKTRVISRLQRSIDLEGLANHRGSTFGQLPTPQPSQIDFENLLSIALMKLLERGDGRIFLEDEGRLVGRLYLPEALREAMNHAPMLVVEQSLSERIDVVLEDYVIDLGRRYAELHGVAGTRLHSEKLQEDLSRIRKRLGGARHQAVSTLMTEAFREHWQNDDLSLHREWIAALLEKYYDPMYEYQLEQRAGRQLFRGDRDAVVAWVAEPG